MLALDFRSYAAPPKHARDLPRDAVDYLVECMKFENPYAAQKFVVKKIKVGRCKLTPD